MIKLVIRLGLAMLGSLLGAFLIFPGLRLAQTHQDALTLSADRPLLQLGGAPRVRWEVALEAGGQETGPTVVLSPGCSCTPASCRPCAPCGSGQSLSLVTYYTRHP